VHSAEVVEGVDRNDGVVEEVKKRMKPSRFLRGLVREPTARVEAGSKMGLV
jgi:hypothetical protein